MTQTIIRRIVSSVLLSVVAIGLIASTPSESSARKRSSSVRKVSHSASRNHKGAKRSAKLSKKGHTARLQKTLTSEEKAALIERIKQLATSEVINQDSIIAARQAASELRAELGEGDGQGATGEASQLTEGLRAELARVAKEEAEEDDVDVSIEQFFMARPGAIDGTLNPQVARERQQDFTLFDQADPETAAHRSDIMAQIIDWIGTKYEFGGMDRGGIDCSAFTCEVFRKAFGVALPRTAMMQHQLGESVEKTGLKFGDLVFFHTANYAPVSHVGIYIGEGLFANAACSKGVSVASLSSKYWSKRFIGAKRLFASELAGQQIARPAQAPAMASERSADEGNGNFN